MGQQGLGKSNVGVGGTGLTTHCMNLHEGPSGQNPTR